MLLIYYLFNIMLLELQNIYIFIRILYRYNSYDIDLKIFKLCIIFCYKVYFLYVYIGIFKIVCMIVKVYIFVNFCLKVNIFFNC